MHIKDYARAEGWFRKHAAAPSSKGAWKAFVARNKRAQEPRTMMAKADIPDAFNPDLEQTEVLRPGETLETWEPNPFLKPHAEGGRIIGKPGGLVEPGVEYYSTSKVYNEKTGHIYPGGNAHSNWWSDKPGKNQHKISLKDIKVKEKVKKFIKENPGMNQKDGSKILGKKRAELVPADQWPKPGKHRKVDPTEAQKKARAKKIATSSESMLAEMAGKEGHHLSHLSLTQLDSLQNLGYLPADINIKSYHSFEKKIVANANEIYAAQNNKSLSIPERRAKIAKLQKIDRTLRKEFPKYSNIKARLKVQATKLDPSGVMIKEIIDPKIAISQEAGTTLKGITPSTKKGQDLLKLSKKSLEAKLKAHLKANPKLAIEIQKQLSEGVDITKILNSPAVKKGMPTWVKGELYFAAADIINNWTKGQSFWKGLGKGIETGSFGIIDLNTDERALLSKGKKLVDQGVITQQEFDSMESWLKYTQALKNRRATQEDYYSAAKDLKENEDLSGGKNILAGEVAGWNTLEAGVLAGAEESDIADKNLDQSIESYYSITDNDSMGYDTMSKVMDHLVGEEWNKPAGTIFDRGNRRNQGEGMIWGPIGGAITDVGNLAASPWLGLKDSNTLEQMKMNFQKNQAQKRIMEHPVYGFEEDKLKHPEAWEDIYTDMDYAINPTEQLWKAEGGIMSLKKKW